MLGSSRREEMKYTPRRNRNCAVIGTNDCAQMLPFQLLNDVLRLDTYSAFLERGYPFQKSNSC